MEERQLRAKQEPLDVRLRYATAYPVLEVRNPLHRTAYLVLLPEFPARDSALCTCTDFARSGLGTCKHIEAGYAWLVEHPSATPLIPAGRVPSPGRGVWKLIDRRISALPGDDAPPSLRYRRPGQALFERIRAR